MSVLLQRIQRGLERMYRIDTGLCVGDFVIGAEAREHMQPHRRPREQLFIAEYEGALEMALFVDPGALDNLQRDDPAERLHDGNLGDFLLAVEGVSHFVYLAYRARADQPVSALELELQAEIDKYVTCLLMTESQPIASGRLRSRVFEEFEYDDELDDQERERYRAANANAHRYSASLERRYVHSSRIVDMLDELRRFYRMSLRGKLELIGRAA